MDTLGGVDVMVERSFTDDSYPIPGRENDTCGGDPKTLCRWEILHFDQGPNHFDGATALKFARSRHSRSVEGTDIARAARQQKIIIAVKQKLFSPQVLLNPQKIRELLEIVNSSIETNIPQDQYAVLARLALSARNTPLRTAVIPWDENLNQIGNIAPASGLLYHPQVSTKFKNQWILLPIGDSYTPIHDWINCLYSGETCIPEDFVKKNK